MDLWLLVGNKLNMSQQQRQLGSWAASAGALLSEIEMRSPHSTQCSSDCTWSIVSSSGPHNSRKMPADRLERVQSSAKKMIKWLENLPCGERLKELGLFSLEKAQGDLITLFQHLKGSCKEDGGSLFKRSHMEKTRSNEYKLHRIEISS
ncbi:hypothetical protein GRJ2_000101200 [Grus japonensis]|uniref:Uncharacterized protein n=1 Tax=Grus japonensis TaxID=30415 RepID=A0ABC9VT39_GRUJA